MSDGEGAAERPFATAPAFPVVGIGASAGGLAAFEAFFSAMPADRDVGAAFVLVQHLPPDHKSLLTELVGRYTRMRVLEVTDGMTVEPDCAYIIPPNHDMAFMGGVLHLLEPTSPRGLRLPIDFFFRSLAQDQRERAIGVVLSGTGSDGTLGARAIKGEGGMVMAQSPGSTEYDGMPKSVIEAGLADYVLEPSAMPAQLVAYLGHALGRVSLPARSAAGEDALQRLFVLLRAQTGHDFSDYKPSTVARRIERRMAVHQIERLDDYVRFLQHDPPEVEALFRDLLIGVTSFFRDPDAFTALAENAIPRLFAGKRPGDTVRVWVAGCSTGEEAYSIAILLVERMETMKQTFPVQVFATDIDAAAIARARAGVFPASIAADVTPERLARFFAQKPQGGAYRVHKRLRDLLIFSEHDVIKQPPFSRVDLISCRNLLIYLGAGLQRKLLSLFHYALNPTGVLFLGTSETVGDLPDLFAAIARSAKLYARRADAPGALPPASRALPPLSGPVTRAPWKAAAGAKVAARTLTEQALLRQVAPVGALVDERGDILYLHGRTGEYLEPAPGDAGLNVLKMAREGLRHELSSLLRRAATDREPARRPGVRVKTNGDYSLVDLTVSPVVDADAPSGPALFLVTFATAAPAPAPQGEVAPPADHADDVEARIAALRQELQAKDEYLQATNEELETANEELRSANEEMQSVNEELQSTNEELETSREELQSVNEELATVNAELQQKVTDLSRSNNDMSNLLAGTGIGTIFVDHDLLIQRFTPAATQIIHLIPTDIGRPVGHIVADLLGYDRLVADVKAVLASLIPLEVEVQTRAGASYSLRIRPYRTQENAIEGAVITFVDITDLRKAREAAGAGEALRRLATVVRDARDAITVQDLAGRVLAWNPAAERIYGWSEAEALGLSVRDLVPEDQREAAIAVVARLGRGEVLEPYRARRLTKDGRVIDVWLTATALQNEAGAIYAVATTERAREEVHQ
jgi:two-component system, chemotaxis family, CheB/CheR fusion protein